MEDSSVESLIRDLLEWLARRPRTYDEVMDAWRTSCPKLPVWEEATDRGFIRKEARNRECIVTLSAEGIAFLERRPILGVKPAGN